MLLVLALGDGQRGAGEPIHLGVARGSKAPMASMATRAPANSGAATLSITMVRPVSRSTRNSLLDASRGDDDLRAQAGRVASDQACTVSERAARRHPEALRGFLGAVDREDGGDALRVDARAAVARHPIALGVDEEGAALVGRIVDQFLQHQRAEFVRRATGVLRQRGRVAQFAPVIDADTPS